jgi:glycosyltransferase involved in cell wall biosynthesis
MRSLARLGLFDAESYRGRYPDVADGRVSPLYHYVRYGITEGRDPGPLLAPRSARDRTDSDDEDERSSSAPASDVATSDAANQAPVEWRFNAQHARSRTADSRAILVVAHDAARAGSQLILLEILEALGELRNLEIFLLMLRGGELESELARHAHTLRLDDLLIGAGASSRRALERVVADLAPRNPMMALCNTVLSSEAVVVCSRAGLPVLSMLFELPTSIEETVGGDELLALIGASRRVVVASCFVRESLAQRYAIEPECLTAVHAGVFNWEGGEGFRQRCRETVLAELALPDDAFLVLGCGTVHHRKGTDLFVQVARELSAMNGSEMAHFVWIGADQNGPQLRQWCEHDILTAGLGGRVRLIGGRDCADAYFGAADAFALCSREDPFPMVCLEAMARGVPVVAFAGAGGAPEALAEGAGIVVPYLDVKAMARELFALSEAPHHRARIGERARQRIETDYRWSRYVGRLVALLESDFGYRPSSR